MLQQHVGENELLWTGSVRGDFAGSFEYRYAVVDGDMNVVRWDALTHTANFPPLGAAAGDSGGGGGGGTGGAEGGRRLSTVFSTGNGNSSSGDENGGTSSKASSSSGGFGDKVEIQDTWEFQSHPENLFLRTAFRDIVIPRPPQVGGASPSHQPSPASRSHQVQVQVQTHAVVAPALEATGGGGGASSSSTSLRLRLEVRTLRLLPGQRVHVTGSGVAVGGWDRDRAAPMTLDEDSHTWRVDINVAPDELPLHYKYALKGGPANDVLESGMDRIAAPKGWGDSAKASPSSGGFEIGGSVGGAGGGGGELGGSFGVGGGGADVGGGAWGADLHATTNGLRPVSAESDGGITTGLEGVTLMEEFSPPSPPRRPRLPSRVVVRDGHFRYPGVWRGAGLAVPVFSLRSCDSVGAGDFGDLKMLVDVAAAAGLTVVQLLPVNDTTVHGMWWDSYPYSSVSVIALHPLYLRLQPLVVSASETLKAAGGAEDAKAGEALFASLRSEVDKAKASLDLKEVDYEATIKVKMFVARRCFEATRDSFLSSPEFVTFLEENAEWLKPYAVFRALTELFGTSQHWRWGALASGNALETVERLSSPGSEIYHSVALHYYIQYHLDAQLTAAAKHAAKKGVILKGDLPIGVDKASVDTWMYPDLFRMNTSTGAPPDDFDPNGQNWGFPTYNWDNMAKDGYSWWRGRMTHLERYFSAMRIDHILGFFRIWELPAHTRVGRMGRFRPSVPIRRHELDSRGLWFIDRLCEPHITSRLLKEIFGNRDGEAAGRFLEETGHHEYCARSEGGTTATYRFKKEFATEEGLLGSDAFKVREGSPDWLVAETEAMRKGLLRLQHNVCLLRDPEDADALYPRIEMEKTNSFQELEEWARHSLSWLYDDYFFHRQDQLWRENARRTLPALMGCTGQLVCGEDLGMVPSCVPPVLEELGILGLRIQRMPHEEGEFGCPDRYPYETVCSPSCHDTTTTRAWYEADAGRRARYAKNILGMTGDGRLSSSFPPPLAYRAERVEEGSGSGERRTSAGSVGSTDLKGVVMMDDGSGGKTGGGGGIGGGGGAESNGGRFTEPQHPPPDKCEPHVMRAIIRQHMASPSALAVFPAQDLLALVEEYAQRPAEEETINDPTNPKHYWRFRLHVRLEDMLANTVWLSDIRQLVNEAARMPMYVAGK